MMMIVGIDVSNCLYSFESLVLLKKMSDLGLPLLVHGEVVDPQVDVFDREKVCIDTVLRDLVAGACNLLVVFCWQCFPLL